jgi:SpoVK/Ycf46/Vps4 family AAA+-type ATPase
MEKPDDFRRQVKPEEFNQKILELMEEIERLNRECDFYHKLLDERWKIIMMLREEKNKYKEAYEALLKAK